MAFSALRKFQNKRAVKNSEQLRKVDTRFNPRYK